MDHYRKSHSNMRNSSTELPTIPVESSFQPQHHDLKRQSIILPGAQVPQEAWDKPLYLLENKFNSIICTSSTDVGRTNLFKIDKLTTGPPTAQTSCTIPLNHQNSLTSKYIY